MFVLKAFIEHALFMSDTPGIISTIGELSTYSSTYTRNKNVYISSLADDIEVVAFTSANDGTSVKLTSAVSDHVAVIAKYVYDHTINATTQLFSNELLQNLLATYNTVADTFECGEVVNDGDYSIPEWVSWHTKVGGVDSSNTIKIWFSDISFKEQFDDYEIVVIPPITPLDKFFSPSATVKKLLAAISPSVMMDNVQAAKNSDPETIVRSETYLYYDPYDITNTALTTWNFLIYGNAGNNIDSINDALVKYILANSAKTRDDWIQILPDIFKHTEFIIVPCWNKYGIPNRTLEAGIYSPVTNMQEALSFINKIVKCYTETHISKYAAVLANSYKSLSTVVVGGSDNKNNMFSILDLFPDYIAVSSTSNDFSRMSTATQEWSLMIAKMLIAAESMSFFTSIPAGMSKANRDGILYISSRYDNINYLIASKQSVVEKTNE